MKKKRTSFTNKNINQEKNRTLIFLLSTLLVVVPFVISPEFLEMCDTPKMAVIYMIVGISLIFLAMTGRVKKLSMRGVNALFAAFFIILAVSVAASDAPLVSLFGTIARQQGILMLIAFAVLFYLSSKIASPITLKKLSYAASAGAIPVLVYAFLQQRGIILFSEFKGAPDRVFSTMDNPIFFGAYLCFLIPVFASLFINTYLKEKRAASFLFLLLVAAASYFVAASGSRGALFGVIAGLIAFFFLFRKAKLEKKEKGKLRMAVGFFVTVAVVFFVLGILSGKANPLLRVGGVLTGEEVSARNRIEIWKASLRMISDSPLTGFGTDQMYYHFPRYESIESVRLEGALKTADRTHSEYLQLAVDEGMLGFTLGLALIIYLFVRSFKQISKSKGLLQVGIFSGLIAYGAQAFFGITIPGVFVVPLIFLAQIAFVDEKTSSEPYTGVLTKVALLFLAAVLIAAAFIFSLADFYAFKALLARNSLDYNSEWLFSEKALSLNPASSLYAYNTGASLLRLSRENPREAQKYLARAEEVAKIHLAINPNVYVLWAVKASANYEFFRLTNDTRYLDKAFSDAKKSIEKAPLYPEPYYILARIYLRKNALNELNHVSETLLEIDSKNPDAYLLRAHTLNLLGRQDEALKMQEKARDVGGR